VALREAVYRGPRRLDFIWLFARSILPAEGSHRSRGVPVEELLRLEEGDRPASFRLVGELDMSTVPVAQERLRDGLRRAGELILDTSELSFIDAQGLRMLIALGEEAVSAATVVRVISCSPQLNRLLEVAVPNGIPGVQIVQD
jgi:anti-anti-sigma factor